MDLQLIARDGVFSAADAARHGLDSHAVARLVRDGRCVRLATGWFAPTEAGSPSPEALHRLTALALGRPFAARAAISHHSLLLVRHLPTYAAPLDTVHLTSVIDGWRTATDGHRTRRSVTVRRRGLVIHRPVGGLAVRPAERPSDVTPNALPLPHAIIQAGLLGGPECALVPADAAIRRDLTTPAALLGALPAFVGHPGVGPVRCALPFADGRHESPGETRTAYLLGRSASSSSRSFA